MAKPALKTVWVAWWQHEDALSSCLRGVDTRRAAEMVRRKCADPYDIRSGVLKITPEMLIGKKPKKGK